MNCHCNNQETNATIQKMEQACSAWAVIPSYTVATSANLQGLRNAFVHVSDINTTFYIDNQLRRIITWKGPVFVSDYDYENNPLHLIGQMAYDSSANLIIIYDEKGKYRIIKEGDEGWQDAYKTLNTAITNEITTREAAIAKLQDEITANKTSVDTSLEGINTELKSLTELVNSDSTTGNLFTEMETTCVKNLPLAIVTGFESTTYGADDVTLHLDTKDLASGGVSVQELKLKASTPATSGGASSSGVMSAFQATQLAALAQAYEAEEKGTTLYEGTASVNNIELSESGFNYDHLVIVAEYMGKGSFALEQQVSATFYPTETVKAFQINATDLTVGEMPMEATVQDIWMISEDGTELDIVSSIKCEKSAGTLTCTPDGTSMFTVTKVIGFGKKEITG